MTLHAMSSLQRPSRMQLMLLIALQSASKVQVLKAVSSPPCAQSCAHPVSRWACCSMPPSLRARGRDCMVATRRVISMLVDCWVEGSGNRILTVRNSARHIIAAAPSRVQLPLRRALQLVMKLQLPEKESYVLGYLEICAEQNSATVASGSVDGQ